MTATSPRVDETIRGCVSRGMAVLDLDRPGWWMVGVDAVNVSKLDMRHPYLCIVGQLYEGSYWSTVEHFAGVLCDASEALAQRLAALARRLDPSKTLDGRERAAGHLLGFDRVIDRTADDMELLAVMWRDRITSRRTASVS